LSKGDISKVAAPLLGLNLDHVMAEIDADRSGKVDFKEFCQLCQATLGDGVHQTRLSASWSEVERAILKNALVKIFSKFVKDTIEDMGRIDKKNKEEEMKNTENIEEKEERGSSRVNEIVEEAITMLQDIDRVEEMVNEVLDILENQNDVDID